MPERYVDRLRRITRAQGAEAPPAQTVAPDDGGRKPSRRGVWLALGLLAVLAAGGWLLVRQIIADSKLQDCVMSGRKNCAPVEVDSAGR